MSILTLAINNQDNPKARVLENSSIVKSCSQTTDGETLVSIDGGDNLWKAIRDHHEWLVIQDSPENKELLKFTNDIMNEDVCYQTGKKLHLALSEDDHCNEPVAFTDDSKPITVSDDGIKEVPTIENYIKKHPLFTYAGVSFKGCFVSY